MFNGKRKAVTFSFDDGCVQDKRLIELFDKYGLKCTFNLNSALAGNENRITLSQIREIYKNHEIAVHTLTHPFLNTLSDDEIVNEIENDRIALQKLVDYEVCGMAYPFGSSAIDERVINLVKVKTKIKYARATKMTKNFDLQQELLNFRPTVHSNQYEDLFDLANKFIETETEEPKIFYIWGHAYEFDMDNGIYWTKFEEFCKLISNRDDIFYGTNSEVLL